MKIENMLNCQFHKWYPLFKKVTFKSQIFKLSSDFLEYLREDGIIIDPIYQTAKSKVNLHTLISFD